MFINKDFYIIKRKTVFYYINIAKELKILNTFFVFYFLISLRFLFKL